MLRLIRGDCRKHLETIEPASVDLVVTDPPYGTTDIPWDQRIDVAEFWRQINRVLKAAGVAAVFAAQPFATELINANRKAFRYELVWHKTMPVGFLDANRRPLRAHELVLIFARHWKQSCYQPQLVAGRKHKVGGTGNRTCIYRGHGPNPARSTNLWHPRSVLTFAKDPEPWHPTQKPVALVEWIVRSYSRPGDLVVDPYMGVGTTAVACLNAGRDFIGIEIDQVYYGRARQRMTAKMAGGGVKSYAPLAA